MKLNFDFKKFRSTDTILILKYTSRFGLLYTMCIHVASFLHTPLKKLHHALSTE